MPKEIEFQAPEGFTPPEDSAPGEPFEVMATLRLKDSGQLCLEAIDGVTVGSEEKEETPDMEAEEEDPGFLGAVEKNFNSK